MSKRKKTSKAPRETKHAAAGASDELAPATAPALPAFPVVGIGASAGGMEACREILKGLTADAGMAIVVVQHLSPDQDSILPELLQAAGPLPAVQVRDGMAVAPDRVYVIPPNAQMEVVEGRLHLTPRPDDGTHRRPIDLFLRSLAAWAQARAIAVIVSGSDADGAAGVREVKGAGGITIAQDPKSAKFDGMPRAAISTGAVDLVLPASLIGAELLRIARHPLLTRDAAAVGRVARPAPDVVDAAQPDEHLHRIFLILRNATGVDFTHYKLPTIRRRMQRRMVLHKLTGLEQYVKYLQQNPAEVRALYQDILIHVTRFFRDPDTFVTLDAHVFPQILAARAAGGDAPVRVWVPGCATGEEAYSIAIALREHLGEEAGAVPVQVFATDVSETAVEQARAGVYPEAIAADVSAERLRRFFAKADGHFKVGKPVRDMCVFARQDLTRDPPFSKLDLIVCRNVLIYLGPVLQKRLMNVFHYAMKPTGFLMLGNAETVGTHSELFLIADKRHRLYTRKATSAATAVVRAGGESSSSAGAAGAADRAAAAGAQRPLPAGADARAATGGGSVQLEANRVILARYSPPGVIVDDDLRIVQFRGQTGAFLEPAPGEASLNLLKMAREGLLYGLRAAVHEARRANAPVRRDRLRVKHAGGAARDVNVEVVPLNGAPEGRHFLILFQDVAAPPPPPPAPTPGTPPPPGHKGKAPPAPVGEGAERDRQLARLQDELAASREYLQSIIQDLEATNEELQSANEEILSANEELQSTNEELDTAKEELQSTNEELNTVNEELQARNEELSRVNSDLVNLLGSVQIAIVMVTGDLRIRRFTPMARKILNLIPTDIGRPIGDIKPNFDCPDLEKVILDAIETVTTQERECRDRNGNWYSLRVRPYKNLESRIDGAVLALFDIDGVRRQEAMAREFADGVVQAVREPLAVLGADLRVRTANPAFRALLGTPTADVEGRPVYELGGGRWDGAALRALLDERALPRAGNADGFPMVLTTPDGRKRSLRVNVCALSAGADRPALIVLALTDDDDARGNA